MDAPPRDAGARRRLLLISGLWPTADRPSAGIFVQRRADGTDAYVVHPTSYRPPALVRFVQLLIASITARGGFTGVEVHVLFPTGLIGLVAARMRRLPLVVYAHGADVREVAPRNALTRSLARLVAASADEVVTNSTATGSLVRAIGRDAVVVPPGVNMEAFHPTRRPVHRHVLYLGGRRDHKGYDIALDFADTLAGPGIREVLPGDVPGLIAQHDVVLMPSTEEPFGLAAAEAIACGRWVVAADVGGLRDIVVDGVNGYLVADGDYRGALDRVPDYDPFQIAKTAERFSIDGHRRAMDGVWRNVWARRAS